jgi:UDP-2,3-diacylglucosamine pyrophosphatase LpxH
MAKRTIVLISDPHLNAGTYGQLDPKLYPHNFEWLSKKQLANLAGFLDHLVATNPADGSLELVCVGDICDNWVYPHDLQPPSIGDILQASHNQPVCSALVKLAKANVKVTLLPGNHDMTISKADVLASLPGVTPELGLNGDGVYQNGCIHAEHGHAMAMFNAPDIVHNLVRPLPLGYFITRVQATRQTRTGSRGREYASYIDDLLEVIFTSQKLAASVFEAILEEADLPESELLILPNGEKVRLATVKDAYKDLYDEWCATHGGVGASIRSILHEFDYLDDYADQLCKRGGTRIAVLGHSHCSEIDKDTWFVQDRIYANCGAWCEGDDAKPAKGTFVQIDCVNVSKTQTKYTVMRKEWDGSEKVLGSEDLVV